MNWNTLYDGMSIDELMNEDYIEEPTEDFERHYNIFKVIKVSEADVDWKEEDREYFGCIAGFVAGFCYEVVNADGKLDYMSCYYMHEDPTAHVMNWEEWTHADYFETVKWNGWEPTGRVVFRGYAREAYDPYEREEYVIPCHEEALASLRRWV